MSLREGDEVHYTSGCHEISSMSTQPLTSLRRESLTISKIKAGRCVSQLSPLSSSVPNPPQWRQHVFQWPSWLVAHGTSHLPRGTWHLRVFVNNVDAACCDCCCHMYSFPLVCFSFLQSQHCVLTVFVRRLVNSVEFPRMEILEHFAFDLWERQSKWTDDWKCNDFNIVAS